ncbi:RHS repeat-associated core domain-containing protein [Pseudomonas sp. P1.31]|uniref:RHS repeat-associated core domain-containing protein n=1 Tax=Pseudomonas sp. P1.31 TaxID=1699311 RepID=UPI00069EF323|nr:RHS repeat-associated core domain-containing protein [Pseudomonas sp. P1.31]
MESDRLLHRNTPTLAVVDPRGLAIASVAYYRATNAEVLPEPRVTRETFDAAGRSVANWDPRLGSTETPIASLTAVPDFSGQPLLTVSVDAGWRLSLNNQINQPQLSWDGAGNTTRVHYDSMGRPTSIEQAPVDANASCVERLYYAGSKVDASLRNQCGRLIRHADTAGVRSVTDYGLQGAPLTESRRFSVSLDHPHWPINEPEQDALLEPGKDKIYRTHWRYDASGGLLEQADAAGHFRRHAYTVDGQLQCTWLTVMGQSEQLLVSDIAYNATAQVEQETAGNGVVSKSIYDPADGRLRQLLAGRGNRRLQDLHYEHDAVGNIVCMTDESQPTTWFANQRVVAVNRYGYDTLYQLIKATGREVKSAGDGPLLPELISPVDPSHLQNYSQSWIYDAGGNLLEQRHSAKPTLFMDIDTGSNRGLPRIQGKRADFAACFDLNGNLKALSPGQSLCWTGRNQLSETVLVTRGDAQHDCERYVYDAAGMRVRKVRVSKADSVVRTVEVRYLPGLELRTEGAGSAVEVLHMISVQAGRSIVRLLHWERGQPEGIEEDQLRYNLDDQLGSCTLELDGRGNIISYEGYYAYGGTAWWMGRSQVEAKYKFVRYSGKERDASGLYYYGYRYYAPWLQRWVNPDPAGILDGLNEYCMVGNSPIGHRDVLGLYTGIDDEDQFVDAKILGRGRAGFSREQLGRIDTALAYAQEIAAGAFEVLIDDRDRRFSWVADRVFGGSMSEKELAVYTSAMRGAVGLYMKGGSRSDQLARFKSNDPQSLTTAKVITGDIHKRIFLTKGAMGDGNLSDTITLALTLIHEITHLEFNTRDIHYYSVSESDVSIQDYWQHLESRVGRVMSSSRADTEILKRIETIEPDFLKRNLGTSDLNKIRSRFSQYKPMAMKFNADSITMSLAIYGLPALEKRISRSGGASPVHSFKREPTPDYD